jgi:hypothetical protein
MATENAFKSTHDQIAILDFGSQYSHLIARRIRELNVYCELHSCLVDVSVLEKAPLKGIILSGGPFSVYEDGAPHMQVGRVGADVYTVPIQAARGRCAVRLRACWRRMRCPPFLPPRRFPDPSA